MQSFKKSFRKLFDFNERKINTLRKTSLSFTIFHYRVSIWKHLPKIYRPKNLFFNMTHIIEGQTPLVLLRTIHYHCVIHAFK